MGPILKSFIEKGMKMLPEQYRGLAQKALDVLSPSGNQAKVQDDSSSAGTGDDTSGGTAGMGNVDTANTSGEIFEIYESESESPEMTEIAEVKRELNKQIYLIAHNIEHAPESLL